MRWRAMGGSGTGGDSGAAGPWGTSEAYAVPLRSEASGIEYLVAASYVTDEAAWDSDDLNSHKGLAAYCVSPPFAGTGTGDVDVRSTLSRPAALDLLGAMLADMRWLYDHDRATYESKARLGLAATIRFATTLPEMLDQELDVNVSLGGPTGDELVALGRGYKVGLDTIVLPEWVGWPAYTNSYYVNGPGMRGNVEVVRAGRDNVYRPDNPSDNMMEPYGVPSFRVCVSRRGVIKSNFCWTVWTDSPCYPVDVRPTRPWTATTGGRPVFFDLNVGGAVENPASLLTRVGGGRVQYRTGPGWAYSR